jgi:hypothetical protein
VPVSLRAFVPEAVLDAGLLALAVGVGWLAAWLFVRTTTIPAPGASAFALGANRRSR